MGVLIFQFYGIESEEMRGYALSYEKLPVIGINATEHPHGKIFTLFHELSHILIREDGLININSFKLENKIEIFCNKVAGEVLVPKKLILNEERVLDKNNQIWKEYEIKALSTKFNVSPAVIIRRLKTLNLISNEYFNEKHTQWEEDYLNVHKTKASLQKEDKNKNKKVENENKKSNISIKAKVTKALNKNSNYYTKLVISADEDSLITAETLSQYLGEKLNTIETIKTMQTNSI
jgi:Zn-dependent peptidase ImmA (M78 family)